MTARTVKTVWRKVAALAIDRTLVLVAAAICVVLASSPTFAVSTTYYQVKNWECSTELPSGSDGGVEIGYTPQLAFPGLTLDDIPEGATFFTTLFGANITDDYTTSVGMHETRRDTDGDGHADKMALQFTVYDGASNQKYMKGVILVLTNGAEGDGVYVQKYCQFYRNSANSWTPQIVYFAMDAAGNISAQNSPDDWSTSKTSYCASGFRTHGMSPVNTAARLVFLGTTLKQISGGTFMAGYRFGQNLEGTLAEADNEATFVTNWPSDDDIQKIVMQFTARGSNRRTAVIELTESAGNVYAKHVTSSYNGGDKQQFSIDGSGNVSVAKATSGYAGAYPVHEFFVKYPPCVKKLPNSIKAFSDQSKTLTLDDIEEGIFTARFGGRSGNAAGTIDMPNSFVGCNKKVRRDDGGSATNVVVEFQAQNGGNIACVIVSFTNGVDGVYATGLDARFASGTVGSVEFYKADGTLAGTPIAFAETPTAPYYTALDLRVTMPVVHNWTLDASKNWTALSGGEAVEDDEIVRIAVTDASAVLTVNEDVAAAQIEFTDANCAQLVVSSGKTLAVDSISGATAIQNDGTIIKTGAGTLSLPFDNASRGVYRVSAGTLKVASVTGSGTAQTIRVNDGATFDMNYNQLNANVVLENGAYFVNSNNNLQYNINQTCSLTLEGNATATAMKNFGLVAPDQNVTPLALDSHTLTLDGSGNFIMVNTTVSGTGKVVVDCGNLVCYKGVRGDNWSLEVESGKTLWLYNGGAVSGSGTRSDVVVSNFVNRGTIKTENTTGTLTVKGTLTPGNAIRDLALADGATIKASTTTAQEITTAFSAYGTVTIDASAISVADLDAAGVAGLSVLTVPAAQVPADVKWKVGGAPSLNCHAKWGANGETATLRLRRRKGFVIVFY